MFSTDDVKYKVVKTRKPKQMTENDTRTIIKKQKGKPSKVLNR